MFLQMCTNTHRGKWHNTVYTHPWSHDADPPQQHNNFPPPMPLLLTLANYFDRSSIFTLLWLALIDFHGVRWSNRACVVQWKEGAHVKDSLWQRLSPHDTQIQSIQPSWREALAIMAPESICGYTCIKTKNIHLCLSFLHFLCNNSTHKLHLLTNTLKQVCNQRNANLIVWKLTAMCRCANKIIYFTKRETHTHTEAQLSTHLQGTPATKLTGYSLPCASQ